MLHSGIEYLQSITAYRCHLNLFSPSIVQVGDCFVKFSQSTNLYDNDLNKWVQNKLDKPKNENSGNFLDDACHKFCNKLPVFGHSITHLYSRIRELENRVTKTESDVQKKVDHDDIKKKVKKTKKKLHEKVIAVSLLRISWLFFQLYRSIVWKLSMRK